MRSLYQDPLFAAYWNERSGPQGEPYKRYVLDPLLFRLVGKFRGKNVLEMGCGNGYLFPKILRAGARSYVGCDLSEENLLFAKARLRKPEARVKFLQQDATKTWKLKSRSFDVVYSNMMLNEIPRIDRALQEAYRVLKPRGRIAISVTHPAWDLFVRAQELATGEKSRKIRGLKGYFDRGPAHYLMGVDSRTNPELAKKYGERIFKVAHFHRTIADYVKALQRAGFALRNLEEPALSSELLRAYPRFRAYREHPVGLVLVAEK